MATQADVRRIALSMPGAVSPSGRFAFEVENKGRLKGFVWVWLERVSPKKPRVPNPGVIAVRVANLGQKDALISADPVKFFTEPHYNGFPAVLVRLDAVSVADLKLLIAEAWRCQSSVETPKRPSRARKQGKPADILLAHALTFAGTSEGIACKGLAVADAAEALDRRELRTRGG